MFHLLDLTINNMTLGGIAIGLGQLVDDSVVNVENMLRRLGENRKLPRPESPIKVIGRASRRGALGHRLCAPSSS